MSLRYTVYRTQDKSSDFFRRCFQRETKDDSAEARELRNLLNAHFYVVLMRTPYSDLDVEKKGTVDVDAFTQAFRAVASPQELALVFRLIDEDKSGMVTYGEWQSFHKKFDPEYRRSDTARTNPRQKEGSPEFLEYGSLLDGILMSCSRFPLMAKLEQSHEPFPPSVQWLTEAMEAEWGNPKLRPHWVYATNPVPEMEEGRRFPDWNGGFTVRDDGHVGMTNEDFCRTAMATAAGLTMPEVVGLRLYTGPGYEALNLSLRANSQRFPVTQYCIDSAIGKMANVAPQQPLLRGMRKPMDPRWVRLYNIYRGVGHKRLALSDPGFVSTTTDIDVATGSDFGGPVLFALHTSAPSPLPTCGFLSNGGDVQWISQYPSEAEILLPSNVILVPKLRCRHTRKRGHGLPLPPEKRVFEFSVFFPWDFTHHCPLVTADFLPCANALLDHVHGLDVAVAQQCKARHPTGVPTLSAARPAPPPPPSLDTLPSPAPFCPGQTDPLDDRPFHFLDPARKSLYTPRGLPPTHSSRDFNPAEAANPYAEAIDDLLHVPTPLLLYGTAQSFPPGPHRAADSPPPVPNHTEAAISPDASLSLPLSSSCLSLPNPRVCSTCGGSHSPATSDSSRTCSFYDLESAITDGDPGSPTATITVATDDVLAGTDALRLAKVRHYAQADVDAALQRLRSRPVYDDGLDDVGLVGNDYPQVSSVLLPFENSAWNVGMWGLVAGGVSAGLATLGLSSCAALGIAAGVTTTIVVASAVPVTVLNGRGASAPVTNVTATPTLTSSTTVTVSQSRSASATATTTGTDSATHRAHRTSSATPSVTSTSTRTTSRTASWTKSPTASLVRTRTSTVTATPTRSITATLSETATRTRTITQTGTNSPTRTPTLTSSCTATKVRTLSATPSPSSTSTHTRTPTRTSSGSTTLTCTMSETPSTTPTRTITHTLSSSGTTSATHSATRTRTCSQTLTATPIQTNTITSSGTTSTSHSATRTKTYSPTLTATPTQTKTLTSSVTASSIRTQSTTPSTTATRTRTPTCTTSATSSASLSTTCTTSGTRSRTATMTKTITHSCTVTRSTTRSVSQTLSATETRTRTHTQTASVSQTATTTVTSTRSGTHTPTSTPTGTVTSTASGTASKARTRSATLTGTATKSITTTRTCTDTVSASLSATRTFSDTRSTTITATGTSSGTASASVSATQTPSDTPTVTSTLTMTLTETSIETTSASLSPTQTNSGTRSGTTTRTSTISVTSSGTASASLSATLTPSYTPTVTGTCTRTLTETSSGTASTSLSPTRTNSHTLSGTTTPTRTSSATSSETASPTQTTSRTTTSTSTTSATSSPTPTPTTTLTISSTPRGTQVTSASVSITFIVVLYLNLQFTSSHNFTAGDSATLAVNANVLGGISLNTFTLPPGCSATASHTSRSLTVTLVDASKCDVPAGTNMQFVIVALSDYFTTFNLTTSHDSVPYSGTAS